MASILWNYAGSVVSVFLQLGYTAYTGRTVAPSSFGAYAVGLTVIQFFGYFATAGLAPSLLRAERVTLRMVRAAHRLGVLAGLVCLILIESTAPAMGHLWRMPELGPMLQVMACQFLFMPGASIVVAALRRLGRARTAVTVEVTGQAVGMAAGSALLACGWNPWGVAATQGVAASVTLIMGTIAVASLRLAPGPTVGLRDLLASCSFLTAYSLVQFATNSAPVWATARLLGAGAAGTLSRASTLTGLPLTFVAQGLIRAVTPLITERRWHGLRIAMEHVLCMTSAAAFIGFGVVGGLGPAALTILLGQGWGTAAGLVPLLAAASAATLLCSLGSSIDQARHASAAVIGAQFTVTTGSVLGIAVAAGLRDLSLLVTAAIVGQSAGHVVQLWFWHRSGLLRFDTAARIHLPHILIGAVLGSAAALGSSLGGDPVSALFWGLAATLLAVPVCLLFRSRIPLYRAAIAVGLIPPARRSAGLSEVTGAEKEDGRGNERGRGPGESAFPAA
ncbi:oligosaccharide flippase family protein [Streptomyces sp. CA-142005]|uniref:oligosaccharide flippase family protein n=1 Tax=Streptomyces sp. CA-142005 TaxID=3240052 RepID=UPI003D93386F